MGSKEADDLTSETKEKINSKTRALIGVLREIFPFFCKYLELIKQLKTRIRKAWDFEWLELSNGWKNLTRSHDVTTFYPKKFYECLLRY